jgi:hypothetical protein
MTLSTTCALCPAPAWAGRSVCAPCYTRLRRRIAQIPGIHAWLGDSMTALPPAWRAGSTRTPTVQGSPPMPLRLAEERGRIVTALTYWASAVRQANPRPPHPGGTQVDQLAAYLLAHLGWIVRQDQAAVQLLAGALEHLVLGADTAMPWQRTRHDLPTPCPACGRLTLTWYGGADRVTCRHPECPVTLTWGAYHQAVRAGKEAGA